MGTMIMVSALDKASNFAFLESLSCAAPVRPKHRVSVNIKVAVRTSPDRLVDWRMHFSRDLLAGFRGQDMPRPVRGQKAGGENRALAEPPRSGLW
jgi:hypothetical protein